jgi:hypothetical protein
MQTPPRQQLLDIWQATARVDRYTAPDGAPVFSGGGYFRSDVEDEEIKQAQRDLDVVDSFAISVTLVLAITGRSVTSCNLAYRRLRQLAGRSGVGQARLLGEVPLDPVLQWPEQLLTNDDVWLNRTANEQTVHALEELAKRIADESAWEGL